MNVIAVITNNSEKSRSAKVARQIIAGAESAGHHVKIYNLNEMPLLGCQNCRSCRNNNCDCVLNDDLKPYFTDLHQADAVVIAAPNYNSQPSGSMITFMNRHYCMLDASKEPRMDHDVRLISVFSQGANADHAAYREHYAWFLNCFRTKRLIADAPIVVGGDSDLAENGEIMSSAFTVGKEL